MPQPLKTNGRDAKRYAANLAPGTEKAPAHAPVEPGKYRLVKALTQYLSNPIAVGTVVDVTDDCPVKGLFGVTHRDARGYGDWFSALPENVIRTHFERIGAS